MQKPPEMIWQEPKCIGDIPSKRSGHSISVIDNTLYLFGGNDFRRPAGPNNELYKLDMSSPSEGFFWSKVPVAPGGKGPPEPRSHHTATVWGTKILYFGGFRSSSIRYNDLWILDTDNNKDEWNQPFNGATETKADGEVVFKRAWPEVPMPRGAHSATIIDKSLYIFGGYGGVGFARRDFNDVTVLELDTFEWRPLLEMTGELPPPRSGHQGIAVNENLYVIGGWNSMDQFADMYIMDTVTSAWTKPPKEGDFGPPRWNFAAVAVVAVPHWKIFVFGGNSGDLVDGGNPLGSYMNDMVVLETGTNSWTRPLVSGTPPTPRGETPIVYDSKKYNLILFGGWANKWYGDLNVCKVNEVVGPPYAIFSVSPNAGPITGGTPCTLTGVGFKASGNTATVRFACPKGFMEQPGEVVSDTLIKFDSPCFEKYGAMTVEGRACVGARALTNNTVKYTYFSVTSCETSVCFGPGMLSGVVAGVQASVIIQSKDEDNTNRTCGQDKWTLLVSSVTKNESGKEVVTPRPDIEIDVIDSDDGNYICTFTYPEEGNYTLDVGFDGTFKGIAGPLRGSPFKVAVAPVGGESMLNEINGSLVMESIRKQIKNVKDYGSKSLQTIKKSVPKDDVDPLIKVKETLNDIDTQKPEIERQIDQSRAALTYFKNSGGSVDKILDTLDNSASMWADVKKQVPVTVNTLVPHVKNWTGVISKRIEEYNVQMAEKLKDFRKLKFWGDDIDVSDARAAMISADNLVQEQRDVLNAQTSLCNTFDFPELIIPSRNIVDEMTSDMVEVKKVWDVLEGIHAFSAECNKILWAEMSAEELDDGTKAQLKAVKNCHRTMRWSKAWQKADKLTKDFLIVIPLIQLLCANYMRQRHWDQLKVVTKKEFVGPMEDKSMLLGQILMLNMQDFSADVEDICDAANKEQKIENTIQKLGETWSAIFWLDDPYKDTDVKLLKIGEEDYEALEGDQLAVQGMLANRFVKIFEHDAVEWQKKLANVADVYVLIGEIQRTWSYLEPLFIHSDEVKRELPEDAKRFEGIDVNVKKELRTLYDTKNISKGCNVDGLIKRLESILSLLEMCKKSLADFLDGRRRQFPRYYFTSEADLLDILSNGSSPEKIMEHVAKVYLCTKTWILEKGTETPSGRPYALGWVSGVGSEECAFEPKVPLDDKVEIYMQVVMDATKLSLFKCLLRSLALYAKIERKHWVMHKKPDPNPNQDSSDPAQIILLTLAVFYVEEVEVVLRGMQSGGSSQLMVDYSQKQVAQLNELIILTQSKLDKSDRTRIMVCITMDAHSRDMVINMIRDKVGEVHHFMWQSQLKHKWRVSPPTAPHLNRDATLRGENGERAEVAICDAVMPYDYEYLGNGPRLVITPLTDRIYVTATQALNLKMGCAPAGPAGTGKTETTKDLANGLAKCCYVFNCSPEMDYLGLGNIFKGLASSGAWGCFDEFNRLVPEVLSVCSVQFKSVCDGVAADSARIVIEGDSVVLDPTCGAFITMNPGYLGRSELPEGLKALFRPITVMVPDLVLICENMLMAEGFTNGKVLASKFYGLYSLLRDLLSKQMHYDWGLRAVKSVLVVAGGFKRMEPNLQEEALLMRALRDFNTPKIVREDEVVFFGLLGDLFPGINPPRKINPELEEYVRLAAEKLNNDPEEVFLLKVVQLEELLEIRHCVFVMGPPGAGKSQCWRTLCQARTLRGEKTKFVDINPKSVRTDELYGCISMATREWKDGLLSKIMRDLGKEPNELPKWIILDGDLDANWIESMNSVMDDNKMLTLASNERIPLKSYMKMIFEIRDLRFATPATVSRAGILFISTDDGKQWRSLYESWLNVFDAGEYAKEKMNHCFNTYLKDTLKWMSKNVAPIVTLQPMNFVQTLLYMLDGTLTPELRAMDSGDNIEKCFVFAMVWAMGSALTLTDDGVDNRKLFSDWWRSEWKAVKIPTQLTVFDYWYDLEHNVFEQWQKSPFLAEEVTYDSSTPMSSVTVPTVGTCNVTYWMKILVGMRRPVMLAGPAGTGKTQIVNGLISTFVPEDQMCCPINFNFFTTSAVLQNTMSLPLVKKTGTNYGPPGQARLVYFVDDVNLPEVDKYDTQSAVSLLRQHLEYEHVYDLTKLTGKSISNTQLISCMNPTAGSFEINPRLQRWFATFAIGIPDSMSLHTIYECFLNGHLKNFKEEVAHIAKDIVRASVSLHFAVQGGFKKTAVNFHYEFNVRHISNVFQGLLISSPEQFQEPEKFVHLWLHESERVYGDRLVSGEDLTKYNNLVQVQHKKIFPGMQSVSRFYSLENADPLVFCHFPQNIQDKVYDLVHDMKIMSKILEDALHEYNEINATMDLVLFDDAMKHVAKIVRVVMNSGGHALLVGVGGSGKQSLSRLSAFICGYSVYQIVISSTYGINDLKEDLKTMYTKAGIKEEGVMFLLTDSQITNERFLVYLNDLLATGNIPDLFNQEELDGIINSVTNRVKALGIVPEKAACWDNYIDTIRRNLHVVLAFSPVGDAFRIRARRFPAIVNCTVIDWFQPWPYDALYSVGKKFLGEMDLGTAELRLVVEQFLPYSFTEVEKMAKTYLLKERRYVYSTPKSFLEFLKLYQVLLEQKRREATADIDRLSNGLNKLRETASAVTQIEADLKISLEEADAKRIVSEGIAEVVAKEKAIVEVETAKAQVKAKEVQIIQVNVSEKQSNTERDLAMAEPLVAQAMAALDTLKVKELGEAKGMNIPPAGVDDIFAATMVLLAGTHPNIIITKNGKTKDRSWAACKKQMLGNIPEYIEFLKGLKSSIDDGKVNKQNFVEVKPLLELEHFNFETILSKNSAAAGLCAFVVNICMYYEVVVTVEPKRLALAEATVQLNGANEELRQVEELVANLEAKLAKLTAEFNAANKDKEDAMNQVARGQQKLDLAQRLTNALASENVRWAENIVIMGADRELLTGDVLLASAFISYVGPFTKPFRDKLMDGLFIPYLSKAFTTAVGGEDNPIPMSAAPDPMKILTSAAKIAEWQSCSLPADAVSTENGTIVSNSKRWPLLIDPQLQGISWLKQKEAAPERNLKICRLGQKDLLRNLERALENGYTILIENINESIDAVLNPVIQRAVIKRGKKMFVKLGDTEIEYSPIFQLFLHTKLSNPHYPPEIQAETTLVNFTVTVKGLEDQLLALVVRKERLDLAVLSEELIQQQNEFTIKMKELEDNILYKLATAQGDITEDVELIEGLENTKMISNEISVKQGLAAQTQIAIHGTSEKYRGVANRTALLFFLMNDLVKIHTYYIYSLAAFTLVFYRGIDSVTTAPVEGEVVEELSDEDLAKRCTVLIDVITKTVFNYVRRGLFEVDKLTVSALLALRICANDEVLNQEEIDFLVIGNQSNDPGNMGPLHEWLPPAIWPRVKALESMKKLQGLGDNMQSDSDEWLKWFDSEKPEEAKLPGDYQKACTKFDRLIILRAMRPDRLSTALKTWIGETMGEEYVFQKPFDMPAAFDETTNQTPVFFVLFAGVDPTPWVETLGKTKGKTLENGCFKNISMGQGQEKPAEKVVEEYAKKGGWVMLQNCHLMQSWVPRLERLLEVVQEDGCHEDFRCFISAEPPPFSTAKNMPESLMQGSVKVANEAPADIKSNMIRGWSNFSNERIEGCTKKDDFKGCLFALCWFHSIVLGRRRFGQQGWSRKYSFNTGDLTICANVLQSYIETNHVIPWDDIRYLFGEIMYGGHITDPWDRRTNNAYLGVLINPGIYQNMAFGPGFTSPNPKELDYDGYTNYVETKLPPDSPNMFGLHANAEIGYLTNWTISIFDCIMGLGGGGDSGGGSGADAALKGVMTDLTKRCPENFEMIGMNDAAEPLLKGDSGPFVVVALQECQRMNNLLSEIRRSLMELDKGKKGILNMSQPMEDLSTAIGINQWPGRNPYSTCQWEAKAWPSMKTLASEFNDMLDRVTQLSTWSSELVTPLSVWLPGLFNPTAYLTAVMQVTARNTGAPLDQMTTETHISTFLSPDQITFVPEDGAFIHGIYIEGARWPTGEEAGDPEMIGTNIQTPCAGVLTDGRLKELLPALPVIYTKAVPVLKEWLPSAVGYLRRTEGIYECPVYTTSFRGHTYIFLATLKTVDPNSKWILTGTAMLMQTDF